MTVKEGQLSYLYSISIGEKPFYRKLTILFGGEWFIFYYGIHPNQEANLLNVGICFLLANFIQKQYVWINMNIIKCCEMKNLLSKTIIFTRMCRPMKTWQFRKIIFLPHSHKSKSTECVLLYAMPKWQSSLVKRLNPDSKHRAVFGNRAHAFCWYILDV